MYKNFAIAGAVFLAWGLGVSCRRGEPPGSYHIAVIMDVGGLGDKGKNDMVWRGCQRLTEEAPCPVAEIDCREPSSDAEGVGFLEEVCKEGARTVVIASPRWEDDVLRLARRYPGVYFVVIGGARAAKNVKALVFDPYDAGYLMGVAAAAAVPAGSYGFIGGRDDEATRALARGYGDGARAEDAAATLTFDYLGSDFGAPADEEGARRAARELFGKGAAVIFAAAGPANVAIAEVAKEANKLVIGYESNQNCLERGFVVTSLNVRWDEVVYEELRGAVAGRAAGGVRTVSIASDLISYPIDVNNRALIPAEAVLKIEAARQYLGTRAGRP